ncbi:hypothetical protein G6F70_008974 [Rhizopus microsporus]|nr:hypothetical protein G6F71_008937 [Rhizopus microsporus]KAG1193927.1 hypothetical protein G6F70_008974 [Rhizopus microsporus]KAG1206273.1 hypothetical protein G6F69_008955 [Rhizopus microsporus]KAG1226538.1 hypothetical protein G6F67_008938 [Rhizopus microsporus]KAG1264234.1 hypothetical protein G6F68_004507 [Rhizopus microsporus]
MDHVLGSLRYHCAIAYLDDKIIYSASPEQHLKHLQQVLQALAKAKLSINIKKCSFSLTSIEFLGFIVSHKDIQANPDKI